MRPWPEHSAQFVVKVKCGDANHLSDACRVIINATDLPAFLAGSGAHPANQFYTLSWPV